MPAPSNPPFEAGALLQPRQLQRWLDCNKVNKLTRAETYLEIPAFSVDSTYRGYSDIVAVFNYEAGRNFSLKDFEVPVSPNYVACVAWLNASGEMVRYKLWSHENERFYFPLETYTHQRIFGNFRIEIWSVAPYFDEIDEITYTGSSIAGLNVTYTKTSVIQFDGTGFPVPRIQYDATSNMWWLRIITVYFTMVADGFPFNLWIPTASDTPPTPFTFAITSSQASALTIYTSVRQAYDYRFAEDIALVTAETIVTNFNSTLDLPFVFPTDSVPAEN